MAAATRVAWPARTPSAWRLTHAQTSGRQAAELEVSPSVGLTEIDEPSSRCNPSHQ